MKRLHANHETADIPVMTVSAHAIPEHIEKGTKAGFMNYVTKPIEIDQLIAVMESCVLKPVAL